MSSSDKVGTSNQELWGNVVASCVTGGVVMLLTNPLDTLKQRYQVAAGGSFKSPRHMAVSIIRNEGLINGYVARYFLNLFPYDLTFET